jgi:hypothetical protein
MMKRRSFTSLIALALMVPAILAAQERRTGGGPAAAPPYDLAAEKVVIGKIVGTDTLAPPDREPVMYLTITADNAPLNVILGPAEWVKKQGFTFTPGAAAEVTGATGFRLNGPAMLARSVKVGAKTLALRDAKGKPMWDGGQERVFGSEPGLAGN